MAALTTFTDIGTTAVAATMPRASYPIPQDSTAVVYSQDFIVPFANYVAPVISAAHGTFTTAYCIGDSELQDIGGGIARYTRQWATVPATSNEWGTFAYRFIGLYGTQNPPYNQYWTDSGSGGGRDPFVKPVTARIYHQYYLCKTGETYESPDEIPVIDAQEYVLDSNPDAKREYLLPAGVYWSDSNPTKEEYEALIAAETEIVAEASTIERYLGEIYVRMTRYVKAE